MPGVAALLQHVELALYVKQELLRLLLCLVLTFDEHRGLTDQLTDSKL
jgi:hypothetical protein